MWIWISWLHEKPADLALHCYQKRSYIHVIVCCMHSGLIRLNIEIYSGISFTSPYSFFIKSMGPEVAIMPPPPPHTHTYTHHYKRVGQIVIVRCLWRVYCFHACASICPSVTFCFLNIVKTLLEFHETLQTYSYLQDK